MRVSSRDTGFMEALPSGAASSRSIWKSTSPGCAASSTRTRVWGAAGRGGALIVARARRRAARRGGGLRRRAVRAVRRLRALPPLALAPALAADAAAHRPLARSILFIAACYTPVGMLVLSGATRWVGADHRLGGRAGRRRPQRGLDHRAAVRCARPVTSRSAGWRCSPCRSCRRAAARRRSC